VGVEVCVTKGETVKLIDTVGDGVSVSLTVEVGDAVIDAVSVSVRVTVSVSLGVGEAPSLNAIKSAISRIRRFMPMPRMSPRRRQQRRFDSSPRGPCQSYNSTDYRA
jgi:hypothetical protein